MDTGTFNPGRGINETLERVDFRANHEAKIRIVVRGDNQDNTAAFLIASYAARVGLSMHELANIVKSPDGKGATPAETTQNRKHRRQIAAIVNRVVTDAE